MVKDWPQMARDMSGAVRDLRGGAPEVMKGFSAIARAALEAKALDTKTKELIALAIGVATRCDACVAFHAQAAVQQGASREEVMETLGMAIYMGAGPSVMYAAMATEAFDQFAGDRFAEDKAG
ncbi:carboxymuconolactone decarboxylase family protein [Azospirillum brasilense]|uniref:Carboxymuconolactone decarboxylase family protein n=1 Tax=Azospirillum brasilense TaxID=192 RepID=A0A0P0EQV8_AZOBR|nr:MULTISPECIES: carboxymuconolactone decarboxylase family protein [Azospirillum]ALJ36789.1 carboxymuconolactone decarboxylase [Azospirillum brasilense]MDW7555915.1 carboxymuconolactone decarboxylase family protein [Azospirillum brasilense]MDW7595992.1 carboxymuconolactone decarboxylase family protein [Azospirillum brasilense]MDW7630997.1 carboxymuconolactone decarboxylase family protein [Azospirillum brasilense]MDX5951603.1 carboxymuconolactone decarboxylase family protein [Azospirillum brasi